MTDQVTALETSNKRLESEQEKTDLQIVELERQCTHLKRELATERSERTWLEGQVKRTNLIFSGIEEVEDKKNGGIEGSVRKVLGHEMKLNNGEICITNCYRMEALQVKGPGKNRKPRQIMVQMNTIADRQRIFGAKRNLKGSDYFVQEDFPREIERKRALLLPIMKAARAIAEYQEGTYLAGDKLVVNKKRYSIENIDKVPANINPRQNSTKTARRHHIFFLAFLAAI
jgi:hypothetical protein